MNCIQNYSDDDERTNCSTSGTKKGPRTWGGRLGLIFFLYSFLFISLQTIEGGEGTVLLKSWACAIFTISVGRVCGFQWLAF